MDPFAADVKQETNPSPKSHRIKQDAESFHGRCYNEIKREKPGNCSKTSTADGRDPNSDRWRNRSRSLEENYQSISSSNNRQRNGSPFGRRNGMPERLDISRRSSDRRLKSPDRNKRSIERHQGSPDRSRRSSDRRLKSPNRSRRSGDGHQKSPERSRRSSDKRQTSPDNRHERSSSPRNRSHGSPVKRNRNKSPISDRHRCKSPNERQRRDRSPVERRHRNKSPK